MAPKSRSRVVDTTPIVEGDWLSDKDIAAWLTNKLYHNEVGEPQAWVGAVRYVVSHLPQKKYEGTQANRGGLAHRQRHMFIVNIDDREGHH